MESDLQQHQFLFHDHQQHRQQQKQMNSGLTRYQSAPSSYFSSFLDSCEDFLNRPNSPETERIFSRFLANSGGNTDMDNLSNQNLCSIKPDPAVTEAVSQQQQHHQQAQMMASMETNDSRLYQQQQQQQQSNYSTVPQNAYQNQSKPPLPDQKPGSSLNYRGMASMGMERVPSMKTGGGNSNLIRHSSSPAGLFSNISIEFENGYAVMKGMGDYGAVNRENSYRSASRSLAASGPMSPIAEMGDTNMVDNSTDNNVGFGESRTSSYVSTFPVGSWDDSAMMSASGAKGLTDDDRTLSGGLNASEPPQTGETGNRPPMLAHHLSLPKTSAEISAIEKFLQFQDSVPCKIRAKRGCATHPRSIAERVRRTRISERMRKLQDLVPNMDKQTNTADMLDLAVDYIKDLQRELQALQENRSKCTCANT